ncbi:hypothetical protein [Halobellus rufus]|uniref:hypothetical protein n=1 Tax=Halobellus rufus TaxID=1448860 RepID=UPI0006793351|nr:hypothetical protein [Halobellus rufus]
MTGFDDLNEAGKEQTKVSSDESAAGSVDSGDQPTEDDSETEPDLSEPAFPFDDSVQAQIYPRQTTHEEFQDFLDIDLKRLLRDRDIRNEAGRELHEAVLRVAMDHPEEVAEEVADQRRH